MSQVEWTQAFAFEIATDWLPPSEVCDAHNVTKEEWDILKNDPDFKSQVKEYFIYLRKEGKLDVKTKAQLAVEHGIPVLHRLVQNPATPPSAITSALQMLSRLGDLESPSAFAGQTFGMVVQINPQVAKEQGAIPGNIIDTTPIEVELTDGN